MQQLLDGRLRAVYTTKYCSCVANSLHVYQVTLAEYQEHLDANICMSLANIDNHLFNYLMFLQLNLTCNQSSTNGWPARLCSLGSVEIQKTCFFLSSSRENTEFILKRSEFIFHCVFFEFFCYSYHCQCYAAFCSEILYLRKFDITPEAQTGFRSCLFTVHI